MPSITNSWTTAGLNLNSTIQFDAHQSVTASLLNSTNHTTSNDNNLNGIHDIMEVQQAFLIFLLVSIIVGNSIVLVAVSVAKTRSRMTFFIMHLAIADILVGLVSLMPDLIWRMVGHFSGGEVLCKIIKFSQGLVTYGSTFVLVSLSIDRLDAIARPLGFSTSKTMNRVLIIVAWLTAAIFSVPQAIFFKTDNCFINLPSDLHWKIYITLIAFAVFIIPALIIAICYSVMVYIIVGKSSSLIAPRKKKPDRKPLYYRQGKILDPHHRHCNEARASSRGIIPQAKIRTIKMTFVIVIVFIVCWSPYFMWNLLHVYGHIKETYTNAVITMFVQSLAPLNSAINPVIYGCFSTRICRQLRRLRVVKILVDRCPLCIDQTSSKIPSETSTMMTETVTLRHKGVSQRRSIYSQRESFQMMETCDLIASVMPEKQSLNNQNVHISA